MEFLETTISACAFMASVGNFKKVSEFVDLYFQIGEVKEGDRFNELYFYKLLVYTEACDEFELVHKIITKGYTGDEFFKEAKAHPCKSLDNALKLADSFSKMSTSEKSSVISDFAKKGQYIELARVYKAFGDKQAAIRLCTEKYQEAMKAEKYDEAKSYLMEIGDVNGNAEKIYRIEDYKKAKAEFREEFKDVQLHACKICKEADPVNYKKYIDLKTKHDRGTGYTEGKGYAVSLLVAVIAAFFMLFDKNVSYTALYLAWGIGISVALHKRFFWDFTLLKSIGGTFLLCAAPLAVYALCDELLSSQLLGAVAVFAGTALAFVLNLIRDIKYNKNQNTSKEAEKIKAKYLDPILEAERKRIIDKYEPKTDKDTAYWWAQRIDLPVCF